MFNCRYQVLVGTSEIKYYKRIMILMQYLRLPHVVHEILLGLLNVFERLSSFLMPPLYLGQGSKSTTYEYATQTKVQQIKE